MSVVIVFPSVYAEGWKLAKAIRNSWMGIRKISIEDSFIVCEIDSNTVDLAYFLTKMFGVEKVAIAEKATDNFTGLSAAIVEAASRIIVPGDRFYIKVIIQPTVKCDYLSRDIEFATSSALAFRLASIKALPAKTENEASRLVLTVIGKECAYICIQIMAAPGGLISGSRGRVLSSIHGPLSLISCIIAAKAGFDCTSIVLPYLDDTDLEFNAKLAQTFATKTGRKKQTILAVPIKLPAKGMEQEILKEQIISKILIGYHSGRIIFSLTTAVHPIWFIESLIREAIFAGKTPLVPMLFLSSELGNYAEEAGIALTISASDTTIGRLQKYRDAIDLEARSAIKCAKKLHLEVGPNYLHDIIDSI